MSRGGRADPNLVFHVRAKPGLVPLDGHVTTPEGQSQATQVQPASATMPAAGWHALAHPQITETARPQSMEPSRQTILQ